jgi:hypothetical protein
MSAPDPRAVRRAGRSYLPGRAICAGAFHPKVTVIVGPARATVAIGSGNLTLAGWQGNAELWTVLRGDTSRCPVVFGDLANWLRGLPDHVRFSWGVPEALHRTAAGLDALLATASEPVDLDVRLVSTSTGSILGQLPPGPVDELAVCAPFHDPGTVALRALTKRLRPTRLVVTYQPELTQLDGPSLAALATELGAEVRIDGETRYRHGKLAEWVTGGRRFALTGSPNLSVQALLKGLDGGGNCEIGIISPVSSTLLSEGSTVRPEIVHSARFTLHPRDDSVPTLLGATRVEQGLHVLFSRALPTGGYLQLSPAIAPPETWERAADVTVGVMEMTATVAADGGSRLRLVTTAQDGTLHYSNMVLVVDPARVLNRPGITQAHAPATRPGELFSDPRLAEHSLTARNPAGHSDAPADSPRS